MPTAERFPSRRVFLESCVSTNDEAARLAAAGAAHGTVVVSRAQTGGRGRHGHTWHSPAGENLYLSCILRPVLPPRSVPALTLAAGIGVCDAVNFHGAGASLKWPNDVVAAGGKLAGILTEMSTRANVVDHVVIGIGVNANTVQFPPELAAIATSLRIESGSVIDLADLEASICRELAPWLDRFFAQGVPGIRGAWQARARLGVRVRVDADAGAIEGRADHIDDTGALVVIDDAGRSHAIPSGNVLELTGAP